MGCLPTYPKFLRFQPGPGSEPDDFAQDVSCVALNLGTDGCGFEQQLEATLKAITPASCDEPYCVFSEATRGHAGPGGENTVGADLFVRPDSLLALVLVTDEDDCSAADPEVFNLNSTVYPEREANLRCFRFKDHPNQPVHPISRYVDGFLATRHPSRSSCLRCDHRSTDKPHGSPGAGKSACHVPGNPRCAGDAGGPDRDEPGRLPDPVVRYR